MPEEPKPAASPDSPEEMSRRQFFVKVGVGSVAVAALGTAAFSYESLSPNVLYEPSPIVDAGKPDHYPPDSVTLDPATAIYVVRTAEGFFALSAICTHLGCMTAYKPDLGIIACPCHGSKFNKDGVKIAGPDYSEKELSRRHAWRWNGSSMLPSRGLRASDSWERIQRSAT